MQLFKLNVSASSQLYKGDILFCPHSARANIYFVGELFHPLLQARTFQAPMRRWKCGDVEYSYILCHSVASNAFSPSCLSYTPHNLSLPVTFRFTPLFDSSSSSVLLYSSTVLSPSSHQLSPSGWSREEDSVALGSQEHCQHLCLNFILSTF